MDDKDVKFRAESKAKALEMLEKAKQKIGNSNDEGAVAFHKQNLDDVYAVIEAAQKAADNLSMIGAGVSDGLKVEVVLAAAAALFGFDNAPDKDAHRFAFSIGDQIAKAIYQMLNKTPYQNGKLAQVGAGAMVN